MANAVQTFKRVAAVGLVSAVPGVAAAQNAPQSPSTQPAIVSPLMPGLLGADSGPSPLDPTLYPAANREGVPTTLPDDLPQSVRDGSYLMQRQARVYRDPAGQLKCDVAAEGTALPIVGANLLPNLQLEAVEKTLGSTKELTLAANCFATEYASRNFLLLETSALAAPAPNPAAAGEAPATEPTTKPLDKNMPANQMLDQMLKPGSEAPKPIARPAEAAAVDRTSGSSAVAPGAETLTVIREGTYLVDRTGRLTKGADGQYEFSFEADGKAMKDPPVLILPNLKLMAMETAVSAANRDLHFRITGVVTEYKQRNYVLLEKVVVIPETVQNF